MSRPAFSKRFPSAEYETFPASFPLRAAPLLGGGCACGDALVLTKTFEGTRYVLVIRHHPDKRLLLYKTLFPSKKKVYPRLPRWQPEREAAREQSFP